LYGFKLHAEKSCINKKLAHEMKNKGADLVSRVRKKMKKFVRSGWG